MRIHNSSALFFFTSLATVSLCAQPSSIAPRPEDYVARAKQLIRRFYPGLDPYLRPVIMDENVMGGPEIRDSGITNSFTLQLRDLGLNGLRPGTQKADGWCSEPVLQAQFRFDPQKHELFELWVWGHPVTGRQFELAKEVDGHREWSYERISAALNDAGAKYGPDHREQFLHALPLESLRPFVGGELKVESVEFQARFDDAATLCWWVEAKWRSPDGRETECRLTFEPFEGRLESFSRDFATRKVGGRTTDSGQGAKRDPSPVHPPKK
jgi:hypothetical protein